MANEDSVVNSIISACEKCPDEDGNIPINAHEMSHIINELRIETKRYRLFMEYIKKQLTYKSISKRNKIIQISDIGAENIHVAIEYFETKTPHEGGF